MRSLSHILPLHVTFMLPAVLILSLLCAGVTTGDLQKAPVKVAPRVLPGARRDEALVHPFRVLAEEDYTSDDPTALHDYADECGSGKVTQWQKTYCDTNSDGENFVTLGAFDNSDCSGDPMARTAGELVNWMASLNVCSPATTASLGSRGTCVDENLVDLFYETSDCSGEPVYNFTQTKCKSFCVEAKHSATTSKWGMGTCYNMPDEPIADCVCHDSCGSCGYYDETSIPAMGMAPPDCQSCTWPNGPFDCMACKDGLTKIVLFDDGMGLCVPPAETQCFQSPGGAPISNCTCFDACGSCGYGDWPVQPDSCITCQDGLELSPKYTSGVGICRPPAILVVLVTPDSDNDGQYDVHMILLGGVSPSIVYVFLIAGVFSLLGFIIISKKKKTGSRFNGEQQEEIQLLARRTGIYDGCYNGDEEIEPLMRA